MFEQYSGRAVIEYYTDLLNTPRFVSLGTVISISDTVSKQTQPTPIVTQPMQNAFPIELGNSHTVSIRFARKNPPNPWSYGDMEEMSNAMWYENLTAAIDRWQARSDGCILHYYEGGTGTVPSFSYQGYIKSINRTYDSDYNEVITGTLEFVVGRMAVNTSMNEGTIWLGPVPEGAEYYNDMYIFVSDPDEVQWFPLYQGDDDTCISEVTISGGPEESNIEVVTITIPKKRLEEFAPGLVFKDGMNRLKMEFMGTHTCVLARANVSGSQVKLKFYADAYLYRTMTIPAEMTGRPIGIISAILSDATLLGDSMSGVTYELVTNAEDTLDSLRFPPGTSLWRVLQVCAMYLGAKLFFADDKAYLLDYRRPAHYFPFKDITEDEDGPYDVYKTQRAVGEVTIDQEGSDPLVNSIVVNCSPDDTAYSTDVKVTYNDEDSVRTYGVSSGPTLTISELIEGPWTAEGPVNLTQGTDFASRYIEYRAEPQRSVRFTIKESYVGRDESQGTSELRGACWFSEFGVAARADSIYDSVTGDTVTNLSTKAGHAGERIRQKLVLSSYTRRYPQGTCEYTFGVISSIDLSESTSQINTSLNATQRPAGHSIATIL